MTNPFDHVLLDVLNALSRWSYTFDILVVIVADSTLLKGGLMLAVYAGLWGDPRPGQDERRLKLTGAIFAAFAGLVVARVLALTLPFRTRPLHADFDWFLVPYGIQKKLDGWSSLPSDHATLFFCLAMGVMTASRRAGWFCMAWTAVVICLPRVYLGLHYPTDILAGAAIGIALAALAAHERVRDLFRPVLIVERRWPVLFYALMFLMMFEIASLFDHVREFGELGAGIAKNAAARLLN